MPARYTSPVASTLLSASLGLAAVLATPVAMPTTGAALAAERPLAERPLPVIRVQGTGEISVTPDMAIVSLSVVREADTAREALTANSAAMAEVIAAMKQEEIAAKDLQTSGFSIQPRYYYPPRQNNGESDPPRIVGYTVSNNLSVRIRDLKKVGAILDKAVTLGVNSGGNINFTNAEIDPIIEKARAAAMADAAARAKTLAEAAGVSLGGILEISESYSRPSPAPIAQARAMVMKEAAADAVPVEAGEGTYSVNVSATWEIVQ